MLGTLAVAAVATIFADSVGSLLPALGGGGGRTALLVGLFAVLAAINIRGVRQGTALNTATTIAKLLPLLLLVAVGAFAVKWQYLAPAGAPATGQVARTSILLIFAFSGIESALVPSGEVKDTSRTVPRAIFIAMLGVTVLYLALQLVAQGVLGPELATAQTPLADAAGRVMGPTGRTLVLVGAAVSMFGYVSGMTLAVPRALFALARDGFLPRHLAAVHSRYQTPHLAIATQSVLVCGLALSSGFEKLAILANLATLLLYGTCCAAAWWLRRCDVQAGGTPFRVPGAALVPALAIAVIGWMLTSITAAEWAVVSVVLAAAAAVGMRSPGVGGARVARRFRRRPLP